jgi:hypothetical protein
MTTGGRRLVVTDTSLATAAVVSQADLKMIAKFQDPDTDNLLTHEMWSIPSGTRLINSHLPVFAMQPGPGYPCHIAFLSKEQL